jgi:hypothetical protein
VGQELLQLDVHRCEDLKLVIKNTFIDVDEDKPAWGPRTRSAPARFANEDDDTSYSHSIADSEAGWSSCEDAFQFVDTFTNTEQVLQHQTVNIEPSPIEDMKLIVKNTFIDIAPDNLPWGPRTRSAPVQASCEDKEEEEPVYSYRSEATEDDTTLASGACRAGLCQDEADTSGLSTALLKQSDGSFSFTGELCKQMVKNTFVHLEDDTPPWGPRTSSAPAALQCGFGDEVFDQASGALVKEETDDEKLADAAVRDVTSAVIAGLEFERCEASAVQMQCDNVDVTSEGIGAQCAEMSMAVASPACLPSLGSIWHNEGRCRPCAHVWRAEGCANGRSCTFCHVCDEESFRCFRRRCRAKKNKKSCIAPDKASSSAGDCLEDAPPTATSESPGLLLSVGSEGHDLGTCTPCAHSWRPNGCSRGRDCKFCHVCGEKEFRELMEAKKINKRHRFSCWRSQAECSFQEVGPVQGQTADMSIPKTGTGANPDHGYIQHVGYEEPSL